MPSVTIPDIDEELHASLVASAASHDRDLEDEVRELLRSAVTLFGTPHSEHPVWKSATASLACRSVVDATR